MKIFFLTILSVLGACALGGLIGYLQPWQVGDWQYWTFVMPPLLVLGFVAGIVPSIVLQR